MKKIFVGQTKLTIEINVQANIADVTSAVIHYIKPNQIRGQFQAVISNAATGLITYDIQNANELDIPGPWRIWAKLTYADGKTIESTANSLEVHPSGT